MKKKAMRKRIAELEETVEMQSGELEFLRDKIENIRNALYGVELQQKVEYKFDPSLVGIELGED